MVDPGSLIDDQEQPRVTIRASHGASGAVLAVGLRVDAIGAPRRGLVSDGLVLCGSGLFACHSAGHMAAAGHVVAGVVTGRALAAGQKVASGRMDAAGHEAASSQHVAAGHPFAA